MMRSMRRLLRIVALGVLVAWLLRRRTVARAHDVEQVTIGFADGSSKVLDVGSPERELLLAAVGGA